MEKLKAGIFDRPQVKELMKDPHFQNSMNSTKADAWSWFTLIVRKFLGNYKVDNYSELVKSMLFSFCQLGCRISIKVYYLHSHMDHFPENLGDLSMEWGRQFHQDLRTMKRDTKETGIPTRWQIYCWSIHYDGPSPSHHKKSSKPYFYEISK